MSEFDWPKDNAELVAQLIRQRDRYEQLVNNMSDLLLLIDPDGKVAFCNRRSDLPPGGAVYPDVGDHALDHMAETDRPAVRQALAEVLSGRLAARSVLFHITDRAGQQRIIEGSLTPIRDDGKVVQLEFLGRDVTEQHQSAEALRRVNEALNRRQADLQRDLDVASKIHLSLLPAPLATDRVLIDLKYLALLGVGGDYVYIHDDDPLRPALAVFDVSGHGIASALVASRVHAAVYAIMHRTDAPPAGSPSAIQRVWGPLMIERLNDFIYASFADLGTFVTLFGMQLDLEQGKASYCGAGHPPALLHRRASGEMVSLDSVHLPIGVSPSIFTGEPMRTIDIAPGDAIWLYTDGLMELRANGSILGVNGLKERLRGVATDDAAPGLADSTLQGIMADFDPPDDDITLVAAVIR